MKLEAPETNIQFLTGGGEMGKLIRAKDWSETSIGDPCNWPQSLLTALSILINAKFPMFLWWGPDLIQFYNDAYRPSLGNNGKHPTALGQKGEDCWPEIWPVIKPLIDKVFLTGEGTWSENQLIPIYRNAHIEDVYWTFSYSPVKDENGLIAGILVVCNETTGQMGQKTFAQTLKAQVEEQIRQLKLKGEELERSEERYHLMVDEVQDYAILFLNSNGIIENWNKGAKKIKGYDPDEIIGKSFSVFYTEEDRRTHLPETLLNRARQTGKALQEGWRVRKDGTLFWASVVITALHNEQNEVIGFSKVTRDLTERREADERIKAHADQLEQKNKELEKINAELKSFAYVSSHDLQEPLRKIQTFSSSILEKEEQNLSEKGKDYFNRIQRSAGRMQTLIQDLLSYSRTSTTERVFINTDLSQIVKEVKNDFSEVLAEKQAAIDIYEMCKANIIPFQFRQLMHNLVSNSLKFSKTGEPVHIKIKSETVKGEVLNIKSLSPQKMYCHITVSDNGIGFDPLYKERIFDIFQRLHGREQYNGTGIGLAIVKKIVENHNGVITATSEIGKGASFDIYIPA